MKVYRYCDFHPTARGWYINLAPGENGRLKDSNTYGPTPTIYEARLFLAKFPDPGGTHAFRELRPVPALAPNGSKVQPIQFFLEAPGRMGLRGVPDRFIVTREYEKLFLYDTATSLRFAVREGVVAEVEPLDYWQCALVGALNAEIPTTEAGWLALVQTSVRSLIKRRATYFSIILPGLERQPLSGMEIASI